MKAHFREAMAGRLIEVVLQGSDAAGQIPMEEAIEHRFPGTPVVLSVGNLKERKGYHISLQAFALLQEEFPDASYRIVGSGLGSAYHKRLLRMVARRGIRHVEFLGTVKRGDLDHLYAESSVFLLASQEEDDHFEGFGLAFLEAGAHALPVVGTRTGGIPDAVRDTETGLLFDPQDVSGMAQGLIRLSRDPGLARELGRNGRRHAETLTWKRYAEQQFGVYTRVLARSTNR
jgi:glycosyltransferase involved in cell wall biosynthesis